MKAIILAGGFGKRLDLKNIPKPMYQIAGKPVLEHNILLLKKHNVSEIICAVHYLPDVIKDFFSDGRKWGVDIKYLVEEKPLGTAGAVKNAQNYLGKEPFFVIYGDNFTNINLSKMLDFHISQKSKATIALFNPKVVLNSGIAGGIVKMTADNVIDSFIEGEGTDIEGYVNAGVYILEPTIVSMIPNNVTSDFGRDIFPKLISKELIIKGYLTDGFVLAIDTIDALNHAEKIIQRGEQIK